MWIPRGEKKHIKNKENFQCKILDIDILKMTFKKFSYSSFKKLHSRKMNPF